VLEWKEGWQAEKADAAAEAIGRIYLTVALWPGGLRSAPPGRRWQVYGIAV
jgi:hypothetical protein